MARHGTSRLTLRVLVPTMAAAMAATSLAGTVGAQSPDPQVPVLSEACASPDALPLKNPGRLTLSTDNPGFPPWWGGTPPADSEWAGIDPYSGEGYEAAVNYAVAGVLGFAPDLVDWIANAEFTLAFQPGPKPFDWHTAQVSIRPERAEAVDFSDPYFHANQALVAMTGTPITEVTTIAGLKEFVLGAAQGTTSFQLIENVIAPTTDPHVLNDNLAGVSALQNGTIDGLIADVNSTIYMRDAQLEDWDTPDPEATVVGQFADSAQVDEVGMVLELGSPLLPCVNEALAILWADGTIDAIYERWISSGQGIPFFE